MKKETRITSQKHHISNQHSNNKLHKRTTKIFNNV